MKSKFKVGDRVYCVDNSGYTEFYVVEGAIYTVVDKLWFECESDEVSIQDVTEYHEDFKLYKEEPVKQFDMHTQPWFIRVNNEQEIHHKVNFIKQNLQENVRITKYYDDTTAVTNTDEYGVICDNIMWLNEHILNKTKVKRHEIKLNFETVVEWPIVESEKDKKIRELKETIEAAAKQIKELEEM